MVIIQKNYLFCVPYQVVCYSVDNPESYASIENEIAKEAKERFPDIPIILVANKSDLVREEEQQTYKRLVN